MANTYRLGRLLDVSLTLEVEEAEATLSSTSESEEAAMSKGRLFPVDDSFTRATLGYKQHNTIHSLETADI